MKSVAAVTMVYNEREYLPLWCKYYGDAFGPKNCYIIDHGSDDGSTDLASGFNVIRIPRSPKDNDKRTRYVSRFCNSLLEWFEAFVHTDVDEIMVHNPLKYDSLLECISSVPLNTLSAIGFDVHQDPSTETPIDLDRPVTEQRRWLRFSSSMCKPVVSSSPIEWSPGFHTAKAAFDFGDFYLFHLRYFDLRLGLSRLARTRSMLWASPTAGSHQRLPDSEFEMMMTKVGRLPKLENASLDPTTEPLRTYIDRVRASERDFHTSSYNIDLHIFGDHLLAIPPGFRGLF